ncbi:glycoside hydrolase family 9 protein [Ideonella sp.]|uniref:glycoside hydrolase family 9 protein n=1 Tax=Ideonella sp. TaxID=1929293 RepID=UPI002B47F11A|nr:glycoside hydrolase family 9 protein [Ideonella sp.]HJV69672.1 glycoside hydrolase family 9 protein [Ideonella sp.]
MAIRTGVLLSLAALGAPAWAQTCQPSAVTPYLNINGTSPWAVKASASLNAGSRVVLGPQPLQGSWSWSGCGTSGSSREQTIKLSASCTATATYTNSCGAKTVQNYTFSVAPAPTANVAKFIMVDQFGYQTNRKKIAVLRLPKVGYDSNEFYWPQQLQVVNSANGSVVYTFWPRDWNELKTDPSSGDQVWHFDFSQITTPGTYEIVDPNANQRSARFEIGDNVYRDVLIQAVRTFFYQRAGQTKSAGQAGAGWADGASHLKAGQDTQARRFLDKNNANTARDLRGGWYDAGDFNKYTSWGAGYVQDLLDAYTQNPTVWTDDFNIPESRNGIPDLLDEVKWGLDWLVRMQNSDGSVLSIVGISHASPPSSATGPSYYGDASTSATLAAAAAYAHGAKVFGGLNNTAMKNYAADLLARARNAWNWAAANPSVVFRNNDESNGTQGLGAGQQETDDAGRAQLRLFAAIKLFAATGEASYRDYVDAHYQEEPLIAQWYLSAFNAGSASNLLYYAAQPGATASVASAIRTRYLDMWARADYGGWGAVDSQRDPYRAYITDYTWGSNAVKGLAGTLFANESYYGINRRSADEVADAASDYLHYLHGVNPFGKVYLTNMTSFGAEKSVNQIFHSWFSDGSAMWDSAATSTYGPAPGIVVGGPNYNQWDWDSRCPGVSPACGSTRPSPPYGQPPQKSYLDFNDGWPLNSWPISENSNGYQTAYIRLLARFVK